MNSNKQTNLIGLSGKISVGKDTVAKIIQYLTSSDLSIRSVFSINSLTNSKTLNWDCISQWKRKAFGDKVKECVSIITGVPLELLHTTEGKKTILGEEWGNITVREFMQKFGTEGVRSIHKDAWVNALFSDYRPLNPSKSQSMGNAIDYKNCDFPKWIVADVRFKSEAEAIKNRGGINILIKRDGVESENVGVQNHSSETELIDHRFDYIIDNNGSLESLCDKVREVLISEKII